MADTYRRDTYRYAMYDGNAAYELERREPESLEEQETAPARRPRSSAKKAQTYGFSVTAALGCAVALVMVVLVLLAHVKLTDVTAETVRLQERYEELAEQSRKLTIAYEETFDINYVEKYAVGVLGMGKPAPGQTGTYTIALPDKGEVLESGRSQASASINDFMVFVSSLASYLK